MSMPIWCLVDGNNYAHRYWHTMASDADVAVATMIKAFRRGFRARRVTVCFDAPPSFRVRIDPRYKANRGDKPAEFIAMMDRLRERLQRAGIEVVSSPGFEADDCIATLCRIAVESDFRVVVASADKDLKQLLRASLVTQLVDAKRDGNDLRCEWYTASDLWDDFGVVPAQWPDFQAMVGDKSDNILGAEGIGEQAAKNILQACKTIDGYYANIWAPKGLSHRQMQAMQGFRTRYHDVRRLVTLRRDVPMQANLYEAAS